MPGGSELDALYKNRPIVVWVEDETTKLYLEALWQDPQIGFLVSGGCDNLRSFIDEARKFANNVFGYRDRDFGPSNRSTWGREVVFRGDTFEIENFLLDEEAMAGCSLNSKGRTEAYLLGEMQRIAGGMAWWMAARATIVWMRNQVLNDFVPHPTPGIVTDRATALDSIIGSSWWKATRPVLGPLLQQGSLETQIDQEHTRYSAALASGGWKSEFSGKEIWSQLWRQLWRQNPPRSGELDTVKAVASRQRESGRVPRELGDLRDTLRQRAKLTR